MRGKKLKLPFQKVSVIVRAKVTVVRKLPFFGHKVTVFMGLIYRLLSESYRSQK